VTTRSPLALRALRAVLPGHPSTTLFLHIPKTAGLSVRTVVVAHHPGRRCGFVYRPVDQITWRQRLVLRAAEVVYGHYSYGFHEQLGVRAQYLTFVREPVARVASMLDQFAKVDDNPLYRRIHAGEHPVDLIESGASEMLNNHMTRILAGPVDPAPTNDPALLQRALGNVSADFAVVGVIERMERSMAAIAGVMEWPDVPTPGRENITSAVARDKPDPAVRRAIEVANSLDLELYEIMVDRLGVAG